MGGGEDVPVVDERPAAELASVVAQLRDPRPLVLLRRPTAHHAQRVHSVDPLCEKYIYFSFAQQM